MERAILDFQLDEEGDWTALLSCGHRQHVRHQPPFINRPWVITQDGRDSMRGSLLNCVRCDRRELPLEMHLLQRAEFRGPDDLPDELRNGFSTRAGVWSLLHVLKGQVVLHAPAVAPAALTLTVLEQAVIPPEVLYRVVPSQEAQFDIEYLAPP